MKTKRIRIAVAMSRDGERWSAQGWSTTRGAPGENAPDTALTNSVLDCVPYPADVHFVEVDIPLPEINTVGIPGTIVPSEATRTRD